MQNKTQHSPSAANSDIQKCCHRATLEGVRDALEMVVFGQVLAHPLCEAVLLGRFLVGPWVISAKGSKIVKTNTRGAYVCEVQMASLKAPSLGACSWYLIFLL